LKAYSKKFYQKRRNIKVNVEYCINGTNVAAFDTRLPAKWVGIFGYAAGRIAESLKRNGGMLIALPEGFFVKGKEGPLKKGELEGAASWAKAVMESKR